MASETDLQRIEAPSTKEFQALVAAFRGSILWGVLLELIGTEFSAVSAMDFQRHLHSRLEASIAEIDEALAGLVKLGLIARTERGYRRLRDHFLIPFEEVQSGPMVSATKTLQTVGLLSHQVPSLNGNWTARLDRYDLYELMKLVEDKLMEIHQRRKVDPNAPQADGLYEVYFGGTQVVSIDQGQG